jgi:DNA polymerase-3 subunit gamma/tau
LAAQLGGILRAEGLDASEEALQLVARAGGGSVRDSQTLLDQVISFSLGDEKRALRAEDVLAVLGGVQEGQALGALKSALEGDSPAALAWLQAQYQRGADLRQVLESFQALLRGLLLLKASPQAGAEADLLPETVAQVAALAPSMGLSRIFSALKALNEAEAQLRFSSQARLVLELFIMKLGPASPGASLGEIVDELRELEKSFKTLPAPVVAAASATPAAVAPTPAPSRAAESGAATSGQAPAHIEALAVEAPSAPIPELPGEPVAAVDELVETAAPVVKAALTLADLKAAWEGIVQGVQDASLQLASAAKDAQLQSLEGGTLTLVVMNGYQRKVLDDPTEHARLEQALTQALGHPLTVRVQMAQPVARGARGGKPSAEEVDRLLRERPEIGRLKELFGAEITEIRHED